MSFSNHLKSQNINFKLIESSKIEDDDSCECENKDEKDEKEGEDSCECSPKKNNKRTRRSRKKSESEEFFTLLTKHIMADD